MIEEFIARRYARALIEIAREKDKLTSYATELNAFYKLCQENPVLMDTLTNRYFDLSARLKIVDKVITKLKFSEIIRNFLKVLIKKGRIGILDDIVQAYQKFLYEIQNKLEAHVTSAKEFDKVFYSKIQKILSDLTGKEIILHRQVNPKVLGGVRVRLGGLVYDGTVIAQLEQMSQQMKEVSF